MGRRRSYDRHTVVVAAKEEFWQRGVEWTAVSDLEDATGLSRSSLYLAFETKRGLFDAALADYFDSFIQTLLGPLEAPQAGLREAAGFFRALAALFADPESQRGCLMINTIGALAGRDPTFTGPAAQFADRFRAAFSNALRGEMASRDVARRSELLAAAALGVWLAVRADSAAAATTCRAVANEISAWVHSDRPATKRHR
jgi:TetR/AcrR family transcriptional repressor of nem operon